MTCNDGNTNNTDCGGLFKHTRINWTSTDIFGRCFFFCFLSLLLCVVDAVGIFELDIFVRNITIHVASEMFTHVLNYKAVKSCGKNIMYKKLLRRQEKKKHE